MPIVSKVQSYFLSAYWHETSAVSKHTIHAIKIPTAKQCQY